MRAAGKVSAVIPTRDRYAVLRRCLDSLAASTVRPTEMIVVDDSSSDETRQLQTGRWQDIPLVVIRSEKRVMMAEARTWGARAAHENLILFVDDDNVVDRRMVEQLAAAAEQYSTHGILGPVMYTWSTKKVQTAWQRISLWTGRTHGPDVVPTALLVPSDGVPNVFMVRRAVFEQCGYFDAALMATYSEPDLAWRAARAGWGCGVVAAAKTWHDNLPHGKLVPRTMGGGTFPQKSYCMIRNRMVMVSRYGHGGQKLTFLLVFSWVWPLLYSLVMLHHHRFDLIGWYWRGWRDGARYMLTGRLVNSFA